MAPKIYPKAGNGALGKEGSERTIAKLAPCTSGTALYAALPLAPVLDIGKETLRSFSYSRFPLSLSNAHSLLSLFPFAEEGHLSQIQITAHSMFLSDQG